LGHYSIRFLSVAVDDIFALFDLMLMAKNRV